MAAINDENLIPFSKRTESEQREIRSKGGRESGKSRRRQKNLKEIGELMVSLPVTEEAVQLVDSMDKIDPEDSTALAAVVATCINMARDGNVAAIKILFEDILLQGAKGAELAERKRSNKANEKLRKMEIESKATISENTESAAFNHLTELMKKGSEYKGLGVEDK